MWRLTLKSLRAHKLRLAMTTLSVVLGVGFVAGTFVLTDTMNAAFDNLFADVTEGVDVVVRAESEFESQLGGSRRSIDEGLLEAVRGVQGVRAAAGTVDGYAQFVNKQGEAVTTGGAPTLGVSWYDEPAGALVIRDGRPPVGAGQVVVDAGTARNHDFGVGDRVQVITQVGPREFEVSGIASFGDADNLGGATLAVFDLPTAQELFAKLERLDGIDVAAADGTTVEELQQRIGQILPSGVEAASADNVAREQADTIKDALGFFSYALLTFAGISLFVGAFIIFNTFSITVAQRTREFALLRALGAGGGQVTGAVVLEAAVIGVLASAVGLAAGFGVALALSALLEAFGISLPSEELVFLPRTAIVAASVGVGVTLVSAVAPARRAARISPMAALRDSFPKAQGFSVRRTLIGLSVTAAGVAVLMAGLFVDLDDRVQPVQMVGAGAFATFLGAAILAPLVAGPLASAIGAPLQALRTPGKLARRNAARNPKRTAATASALMVGLALVGMVSIMAASIKASTDRVVEESLRADFTVSAGGFGAPSFISPEVARTLDLLDEVEAAVPLRLGQFRTDDGKNAFMVGIHPARVDQVADLQVVSGEIGLLEDAEIFLYTSKARELGLEPGDALVIQFAATGRQALEVAGLFDNKGLVQSDYLVSLETFEAHFPQRTDFQVLIKLADGVEAERGREAIEGILTDYPAVQLQDQAETKQTTASEVNQLLGLISALLGLALLIALFGIANTLALSVFERTRELGLMRAVGMGRRQVRAMVRWEAVIISVIGAVLGLAIGVLFGWALVTSLADEGIGELAVPYGQLVAYLAVAALAGVLAALLPARRASRLDVLEAISTE